MSIAIRSPSDRNPRPPDVAVSRNFLPGSVLVEIFIPNDFWGNILRRNRTLALVAHAAPVIETVVARSGREFMGE